MGYSARPVLLIALLFSSWAMALKPGDKLPDFVMPADNGWPQRLSEQIGSPVMLIWLDDCDACGETLVEWQYLAESRAHKGLQTWFLYQPKEGDRKTRSRLPLLRYQPTNKNAWWFAETPAVMLVSPDGVLDHLYVKDVDERKDEIATSMDRWLQKEAWLQADTE